MKKIFVIFILGVMGISTMFGIKVSTSIVPYYLLVKEIILKTDEVNLIIPEGKSPHTYALTPREIISLYESDIIIANGFDSEIFIEKLFDNLEKRNIKIFYASSTIPIKHLVEMGEHHHDSEDNEDQHHHSDSEDEDDHHSHKLNPHIWMNPYFIYEYVIDGIVNELVKLNSSFSPTYINNARVLKERLKKLDEELKMISENLNASIITFHDAFPYFANRYDIEIAFVVQSSPGVDPTPRELTEMINHINEHNVRAIFIEPQLSDRAAKRISDSAGIKIGILDPLGNLKMKNIDELFLYNMNEIIDKTK